MTTPRAATGNRPATGRSLPGRSIARLVETRCDATPKGHPERDETPAERADRNLNELLQELRVAQTGVQLMFGFLLALSFTSRFAEIVDAQRYLYVGTLVSCTLAFALLVAPVATHRALFQRRMKPIIVVVSHYLTIAGLVAMVLTVIGSVVLASWEALGVTGAVSVGFGCLAALVVLWVALPSVLRLHLARGEDRGR